MNQIKHTPFLLVIGVCYFALANPAAAQIKALPTSEKHRIVLLTDIGGDRDDEQSFTRFMMYADQYDIEGLIATSIRIFPKETGTMDIDGDSLSYRWQSYPEAGSYKGQIKVENADQMAAKFVVPEDAAGKTAHVLLVVSDDGTPALTRYRRLVVSCQ